ncbi:tRNA pseudouridine(38-40) synthase TruA [Buchnera aphidicola (Taiwanaphis decaspermi)]|uniref:tRNA pseudouridine(38-40) synthase TruA n=1 Tax=Buchnera aphidicola TaxID=9 RepID=UPI0031B87EB6
MKIAAGVEYCGSSYHGWQVQNDVINSVQKTLEKAISLIACHNIKIFCAGRTDSGVHSLGQVIHFSTHTKRKSKVWLLGINYYLPKDISIKWIKKVSNNFDARFSACSRRYFYIIYNSFSRPAVFFNYYTHISKNINIDIMNAACKYIIGEHDFSSFRSSSCQSKTSYRRIIHLFVVKKYKYIVIDIKANAFLHNMVRIIVGSLIKIGCGQKTSFWMYELLTKKNRKLAGPTAPSKGLYFVSVHYPKNFNIPTNKIELNSLFF